LIAKEVAAGVVNAGDGINEHPTQALLDLFTIREKKGAVKGLNVVIVGDIAHSRVARSNIKGLTKMGANVTVSGPPTMIPVGIEAMGARVDYDPASAVLDQDVIMMLRIQLERQGKVLMPGLREYASYFGLSREMMQGVRKDAIVMHPGPVNRGVEISSEIADSRRSVILEQVTNGVAVRMAVLYLLIGGAGRDSVD
jgi:aspartate carbamoyltransferase catalytic subunit